MTKEKPTLSELAADAEKEHTTRMIQAEQIKSDAYLNMLEERRVKAWLVALQTYQHLREVAQRN